MPTEIIIFKSIQGYKDKCEELEKDANLRTIGGFRPYIQGGYESTLFENRNTLEKTFVQFTPD